MFEKLPAHCSCALKPLGIGKDILKVLVDVSDDVNVILPDTVTTLPTRKYWQTYVELAEIFTRLDSVGVYVPEKTFPSVVAGLDTVVREIVMPPVLSILKKDVPPI